MHLVVQFVAFKEALDNTEHSTSTSTSSTAQTNSDCETFAEFVDILAFNVSACGRLRDM